MKPIAVFFHCLFFHNHRVAGAVPSLSLNACTIIKSQMTQLANSGLLEAAAEFHVGINGDDESLDIAKLHIPPKANLMLHGLEAKSETPTIVKVQEWALSHPGAYVFYFHSKGASHVDANYLQFVSRWRNCMMGNLVDQWRRCVADLDSGFDSVGCHWMTNMSPPSDKDSIWGGNFWWVTTDFLNTLEPITERELIKTHGINAPIARMESERFLGAGPNLPKIKDYHVNGIGSCP